VKEMAVNGDGMPKSKDEWGGVMEFWSERLGRRMEMGEGEGIFEVVSADRQES
jgi:hypothetical protein